MKNLDIEPLIFPDVSGPLWYLDRINNSKLLHVSGRIKAFEWEFGVNRIRAPHVVGSGNEWRLVSDLWADSIEVAARHTLESHRQLPFALSCEDAVYIKTDKGFISKYMWVTAVYGGEIRPMQEFGSSLCENVRMRNEKSRVTIRGSDNRPFNPSVAIMEVTLIDGALFPQG